MASNLGRACLLVLSACTVSGEDPAPSLEVEITGIPAGAVMLRVTVLDAEEESQVRTPSPTGTTVTVVLGQLPQGPAVVLVEGLSAQALPLACRRGGVEIGDGLARLRLSLSRIDELDAECQGGLDEDCDGAADCDDPDCDC